MYKMIIVDDEAKILSGLAEFFPWNEIGFTVVGAFSSGKAALEYIKKNNVDVIFTDIQMPEMTGIEMARAIRELSLSVHVIFLSSYTDFSFAQEAISLKAYSYLVKPIKYPEVMDVFYKLKEELDAENSEKSATVAQDDGYYEKIIASIKQYVVSNLETANLEEIALQINMSSSYVSKLFKQKAHINFSEYLFAQRMEKAAELLRDVSLKSYQIAAFVGYDSPHNFSRAFKQYFGVSPREYREGKVTYENH